MEQLNTLIIEAKGTGRKRIYIETIKSALHLKNLLLKLPDSVKKYRFVNTILNSAYANLSYMDDWKDAFSQNPFLKIDTFNINDLTQFPKIKSKINSYQLIIILHSAAGDDMSLLLKTIPLLQKRKAKLAMFIGNEYDLMEEKFRFIKEIGAEFICSQLPLESAEWLYAELQPAKVLHLPHALNPKVYFPEQNTKRAIDIGFRGDLYTFWIGDNERNDFLKYFLDKAKGLHFDVVFNKRLARSDWAKFLNHSKGIFGGESGSYFLDRQGSILHKAKTYYYQHPTCSLNELEELFFKNPELPYISGKAISSRHFEPIGTKTCQILLEGHYNGILKPDEHYISVKKDYSNFGEAVERFKDDTYRNKITEQAYQLVMSEHTYKHRVDALLKKMR